MFDEVALAEPRAGEFRVRLAASGVCHSDWHLATGATRHPMPCVAGHEGAGVVDAVGPEVSQLAVGDRVILSWAPNCGTCFYCQRGRGNLCETYSDSIWGGTMLDGETRLRWRGEPLYHYCGLATYAPFTVVPVQSCVRITQDIPLHLAALIGCGVATGVGAAMYTSGVRPGDSVAVFGCGGVGLNVIQGAALCGAARIVAVDVQPGPLERAREFGATETVLWDALDTLYCDHVFEAVGVAAVQERALSAVRPGGCLTLAGLSPMGTATNFPAAELARQEKVVRGSYYGSVQPPRDFPLFVDLFLAGRLKLSELVTRQIALYELNEAFAAMLKGDVARSVIVF